MPKFGDYVPEFEAPTNGTIEVRGRVTDWEDTVLQAADVSDVVCTIYKETRNGLEALAGWSALALTVADVVENAVLSWDEDADGYNVHYTPTAGWPSERGQWYRVELTLTPASGEPDIVIPFLVLAV